MQQLLGELLGPVLVEHADDRQDQQPLAHLQHRGRQLQQRVLLLADDPFPLLDEADGHRVGDSVGCRLVGVEHVVEELEVMAVLLEERAGQHVPQQQDDPDHLVRLDAARDDPLGEVARVVPQRLDAARLEHLDVVVVHRGRLGEHLLVRHGGEQVGIGDPLGPLLPQLGAVVAQVGDQLGEQLVITVRGLGSGRGAGVIGHVCASLVLLAGRC